MTELSSSLRKANGYEACEDEGKRDDPELARTIAKDMKLVRT